MRYAAAFLWFSILVSLVLQFNSRLVAGKNSSLFDPSPAVAYGYPQTLQVYGTGEKPTIPTGRVEMVKQEISDKRSGGQVVGKEIGEYICSKPWPCGEAKRVAFCESSFRTQIVSKTGDVGLFQIAPVHNYSVSYLSLYRNNIDVAYQLYKTSGWKPWKSSYPCHKLI